MSKICHYINIIEVYYSKNPFRFRMINVAGGHSFTGFFCLGQRKRKTLKAPWGWKTPRVSYVPDPITERKKQRLHGNWPWGGTTEYQQCRGHQHKFWFLKTDSTNLPHSTLKHDDCSFTREKKPSTQKKWKWYMKGKRGRNRRCCVWVQHSLRS